MTPNPTCQTTPMDGTFAQRSRGLMTKLRRPHSQRRRQAGDAGSPERSGTWQAR